MFFRRQSKLNSLAFLFTVNVEGGIRSSANEDTVAGISSKHNRSRVGIYDLVTVTT